MDKQQILKKLNNDGDKLLVARMFDLINKSTMINTVETTDFLDMRNQLLLEKILKQIKFKYYVFCGGIEEAERKLLIFYPEKLEDIFQNKYYNFNNIMDVIKIKLNKEEIGKYSHRTYLGALMKLGIKRDKIGDIIVDQYGADIICKDICKFLQNNLCTLKRFSKSEIRKIDLAEIRKLQNHTEKISIILPSMRLDSIVSELAHTSRIKSIEILKQERVLVNFQIETKSSKNINEGDIITIRGKGRFKIIKKLNYTKKGNLLVEVEKFI